MNMPVCSLKRGLVRRFPLAIWVASFLTAFKLSEQSSGSLWKYKKLFAGLAQEIQPLRRARHIFDIFLTIYHQHLEMFLWILQPNTIWHNVYTTTVVLQQLHLTSLCLPMDQLKDWIVKLVKIGPKLFTGFMAYLRMVKWYLYIKEFHIHIVRPMRILKLETSELIRSKL